MYYNPNLKDKHSLVDLATYGTKARKSVHSDVLIGDYPRECPMFKEGDILDANATFNLIKALCCKNGLKLNTPSIWTGTQDEYDAITTKDQSTIYFIYESGTQILSQTS